MLNKVTLIGNLGNDPEIKELTGGKKVCKASLATSEKYKKANGEKVEDTQWHNLVAWDKVAEIFEKYLSKGDRIYIEGKIINRTYDDKEGVKKYITEINVREIKMLSSKKDGAAAPAPASSDTLPPAEEPSDDLPF